MHEYFIQFWNLLVDVIIGTKKKSEPQKTLAFI